MPSRSSSAIRSSGRLPAAQAYKAAALRTHPDKRRDTPRELAEREFNEVKAAYELLCDKEARAAWDSLAQARGGGAFHRPPILRPPPTPGRRPR